MKYLLMMIGLSVVLLGVLPGNLSAEAQGVCQISYSGLNKARKVMGPVATECGHDGAWPPPGFPHSVPFGNWGVTSNIGHKIDGHQFNGWCHNSWVCDNDGNCDTHCQDGWYEWNSCTTYSQWEPPNRTLYNSNGNTQQVTTRGENTHGTVATDIPVNCPTDSDGDGYCDTGGCADVHQFTSSGSFMTLYELDGWDDDEVVQSLYFPAVSVPLDCTPTSCSPTKSPWVSPSRYDTLSWPALVDAKLAVKALRGWFSDRDGVCADWAERGRPGYDCE